VREHIGDGGMATVYKAWHTGLQRFEALKIPRRQSSHGPDAEFVHRLLAEARTAAALHHPHIVAIHNVSEADSDLPYFSMDLIEGRDLQQLIKERGRLSFEEALPILQQVGAAIDYAHSRHVIHRDIKPANILLHEDSRHPGCNAKVVDFGISHAVEDPGGTRLTAGGMFVGTPEYMSPEQSGSGPAVDHRTDIYSLGIVAYEMLCGQPPFVAGEGVSRISIIMKHATQTPPPVSANAPGLNAMLDDAVMKALAKAPDDRYQSCAEFLQAIQATRTVPAAVTAAPATLAARLRPATTDAINPRATAATVAMAPAGAEPTKTADVEQLRTRLQSRPASRRALLFSSLGGILAAALLISWVVTSQLRPTSSVAAPPKIVALPTPTVAPTPTPKVQVKRTTRRVTIPYPRLTRKIYSMLVGQKKLNQRGYNGIKEITEEISTRGSKEISRRAVGSRIITAPGAEVQFIGARSPVAARPKPRPAAVKVYRRPAPAKVYRRPVRQWTPPKPVWKKPAPVKQKPRPKPKNKPAKKPDEIKKVIEREWKKSPTRRRVEQWRRSYDGAWEAPLP